jgi:hypothetical protein
VNLRLTFANRRLNRRDPRPVSPRAPSGAIWEWNEPSETSRVAGSAIDFCQTVTQVRNFLDTRLEVVGDVAMRWMAIAQCFAGRGDPQARGARPS